MNALLTNSGGSEQAHKLNKSGGTVHAKNAFLTNKELPKQDKYLSESTQSECFVMSVTTLIIQLPFSNNLCKKKFSKIWHHQGLIKQR